MGLNAFSTRGSREFNKLAEINKAIMSNNVGTNRGSDDRGLFAEFTAYFRGVSCVYRVYTDGYVIYRKLLGDSDFRELNVTTCKNNTYPEVRIDSTPIKLYNLVHACFEPNFCDWFERGVRKVVNHTVSTDSRYGYSCDLVPHASVWADLDYTEVVTISENNRHGKFVSKYQLANVYVSAFDIDDLLNEFKQYAQSIGVADILDVPADLRCNIVVNYYNAKCLLNCDGKPKRVDFR